MPPCKTPIEVFTTGLVSDYWAARLPIRPQARLTRGTARVVSSLAEERVAEYLLASKSQIKNIFLDQQVRYLTSDGTWKLRKPDLIVTREEGVALLVEVKMDMGFIRDGTLVPLAKTCAELLTARKRSIKLRGSEVPLATTCHYVILLLSGLNINPDVRGIQVRAAGAIHPRLEVLVPWPAHHANNHNYATQEAAVDQLLACHPEAVMDRLAGFA